MTAWVGCPTGVGRVLTWAVTLAALVTLLAACAPGQRSPVLVTFKRPMVGMKDVLVKVGSNDVGEPEQTPTLRFEVVP